MQESSSKRPNLTHDVKIILDKLEENKIQITKQTTYEEVRKYYEENHKAKDSDLPAHIQDIEVEDGTGKKIPVRIVRPENNDETLPVLFYLHGGGWVTGTAEGYDRFIRKIVNCSQNAVVFPSYSLSPEVKYPTAINECYEVLKYISEHGQDYKLDKDKIAVIGDSAGGNMAAVMPLMAKEKKGPDIKFQILMCPMTDLNLATDSIEEFANGPWITKVGLKWYRKQYLVDKGQRDDAYASPLIAEYTELAGLPPAFIITAESDPLRDDGEAYARRLNKADVPVSCVRYNGTIHNFIVNDALADTLPSKMAMAQICSVSKRILKN